MQFQLKKIGKELSSRNKAIGFFDNIDLGSEQETVILDFEDVNSITPSFAHEMLSLILKNKKSRRISFKNTNDSIVFQIKKALISIESQTS